MVEGANSRQKSRKIAIIGGTGAEGSGLATRLARAGHTVVIGSRDPSRARHQATRISDQIPGCVISGSTYEDAARKAEIVLLAVPFVAQTEIAIALKQALAGKLVIDATVPLVAPKVSRVQLPNGESAVLQMQRLLGKEVRVVAAFQNVSAHGLAQIEEDVDCDVLVFGDDAIDCDEVIELIESMRLRGIYGGLLCNSAAAEALTSVLIAINKRYQIPGAGIRITGLVSK